MSKIDFYNINNNDYKPAKDFFIYDYYSNAKRKVKNKIYHEEEEKTKKCLKELKQRYCFLYENAPLIVAFMIDYLPNSFLEEVKERIGYSFEREFLYCNEIYLKNYRYLTVLEILEDYMLGYDNTKSNDLEKIVAHLKKNPDERIKKVQEEFDFSKGNVGIGKFDFCMKILVDSVYSFVLAQKEFEVFEAKKTNNGFICVEDDRGRRCCLYNYDIDLKLNALNLYYSILSYRNKRNNKNVNLDKGMKKLQFTDSLIEKEALIRISLVGRNKFLEAFSTTISNIFVRVNLSNVFNSEIYERVHDEIPYFHNAICNKIHGVENGCNTEFFPQEEDIFYLNDDFKTLCPCCGALVETGVMNRYHKRQIEERIKKRSLEDLNLERKVSLLSELISIDGVEYNKDKVKKR